jgi:hypothetical protein
MKKFIKYTTPILILLAIVVPLHDTHAQSVITSFLGFKGLINLTGFILGFIFNILIALSGWFLGVCGTLLNVSLNATLHIKDIVDATPAVYEIWKAIRDISGIFIIFFLLYASIRLILDIQPPNFGDLIKNIIIAGILINFSFFFTGLLIDLSNMTSLAIYRAITPERSDNFQKSKNALLFNDGGISDTFMQSLQIQKNLGKQNVDFTDISHDVSFLIKSVVVQFASIMIMITTALSFLAAAIMFVIRIFVLIMLLAFSPIWFAAAIIPELNEYAKKWWGTLTSQLIFMPVYLILMYAGISILTKSSFFKNAGFNLFSGNPTFSSWTGDLLALFVNTVFVIVMLNVPLIAALKLGGDITGFISKRGWDAGNIWKKVSGTLGVQTLGRGASWADKKVAKTPYGNSLLGRDFRSATIGAVAKNKMGTSRSFAEQLEEEKKVKIEGGQIKRKKEFNDILERLGKDKTHTDLSDHLNKMSSTEKLALGKDKLKDPNVLRHLSRKDFEAIDKSEMSDEDKKIIVDARHQALKDAIKNGNGEVIEEMMGEYNGEELVKYIGGDALSTDAAIEHLTGGQLKQLADSKLDPNHRREIGQKIYNWQKNKGKNHRGFGQINDKKSMWGNPTREEDPGPPQLPINDTSVF